VTRERLQILADTIMAIKKNIAEGKDWSAYVLASSIIVEGGDLEEQLYLSTQLDAKERNIVKAYQEAERRANGQR